MAKVFKWSSTLGVFDLLHPLCYRRWRATLITLMSCAECSKPSHNEICSRRNRPQRLGRTLGHMAQTAVISMAGGWMLQIGKRLGHPGLWPWWRVLKKDSAESSSPNMILSFVCDDLPSMHSPWLCGPHKQCFMQSVTLHKTLLLKRAFFGPS